MEAVYAARADRSQVTPLAESRSKNKVAWDWRRRMEAGQSVWMGPRRAAFTATAFRFSGEMQSMRLAEQSIGMVRVKAYWGTASRLGKWRSPTCCWRQGRSSLTSFTW